MFRMYENNMHSCFHILSGTRELTGFGVVPSGLATNSRCAAIATIQCNLISIHVHVLSSFIAQATEEAAV